MRKLRFGEVNSFTKSHTEAERESEMSRDNDGGNVDREKKRGGESRQNLRDNKELHYAEGEVIYVKI